MKIILESDLFLYFDRNRLCTSLFLGPEQSDPYTSDFQLDDLMDYLFEMNEVPNTLKITKSGADEIKEVIQYLRDAAQKAEDKLSTYTILKEKK